MLKCVVFEVTEGYYHSLLQKEEEIRRQLAPFGTALLIEKETQGEGAVFPAELEKGDMLFITDSLRLFQHLGSSGFFVIPFYHEGNRQTHFAGARYAVEEIGELSFRSYEEVYQRLAGLPWGILETEHLQVRESVLSDVEAFYRIYAAPSITYYMENLFQDPREERAYMEAYIRQVYGFYGFGLWTVLLKEESKVIGRAGLSVREGYELPELGFVIDTEYQRRGYGYEVCSAILRYAKEELEFDRVQALVKEENDASVGLLCKLGFCYEKDVAERKGSFRLYTVAL